MAPNKKIVKEFQITDTVQRFEANLLLYSRHEVKPTLWKFLSQRYKFREQALNRIIKCIKNTLGLSEIQRGEMVGANDLNVMFDIVGDAWYDEVSNGLWIPNGIVDYVDPTVRPAARQYDYGEKAYEDLSIQNQNAEVKKVKKAT